MYTPADVGEFYRQRADEVFSHVRRAASEPSKDSTGQAPPPPPQRTFLQGPGL